MPERSGSSNASARSDPAIALAEGAALPHSAVKR